MLISKFQFLIIVIYRSWDISVDGLCTDPVDTVFLSDFPVFSCALYGTKDCHQIACGGGNGETSFVGTPIHLFSET